MPQIMGEVEGNQSAIAVDIDGDADDLEFAQGSDIRGAIILGAGEENQNETADVPEIGASAISNSGGEGPRKHPPMKKCMFLWLKR